jgi:tetrahydromethanopterin S-methyltransferase subunit H
MTRQITNFLPRISIFLTLIGNYIHWNSMELGIQGKVAVITGGDSGIGRATAKLLADEGVKIPLLDKTTAPLQATLDDIQSVGEATFP